jgi:isopenicillin N synthase-like dioxygenase
MTTDIPVIDLAPLRRGGAAGLKTVARQLGQACREVGFFAVTGHGIDPDLTGRVFAASRDFFARSAAEKTALSITGSPHNRGYVGIGAETLDTTRPSDLKEAFNIGLDLPADHPEVVAGRPFRGVNLWPGIPGWREAMLAYFDAAWRLGRQLHRGFASDLGLDPDHFESRLDAPMAILRLLHYPPRPGQLAPGQMGAGTHTDYGNVTILATDGVAGLQVRRRDGVWLDAPAVDGGFLCNIGDCLMRWTNDVYVSTPHRVQLPERERFSVVFFLDPNPDARVESLPGCVTPDRPARYPPVLGADYLQSRLDATYAHLAPRGRAEPSSA